MLSVLLRADCALNEVKPTPLSGARGGTKLYAEGRIGSYWQLPDEPVPVG
jgi:hypothetical protein